MSKRQLTSLSIPLATSGGRRSGRPCLVQTLEQVSVWLALLRSCNDQLAARSNTLCRRLLDYKKGEAAACACAASLFTTSKPSACLLMPLTGHCCGNVKNVSRRHHDENLPAAGLLMYTCCRAWSGEGNNVKLITLTAKRDHSMEAANAQARQEAAALPPTEAASRILVRELR